MPHQETWYYWQYFMQLNFQLAGVGVGGGEGCCQLQMWYWITYRLFSSMMPRAMLAMSEPCVYICMSEEMNRYKHIHVHLHDTCILLKILYSPVPYRFFSGTRLSIHKHKGNGFSSVLVAEFLLAWEQGQYQKSLMWIHAPPKPHSSCISF